MEGEDFGSSSFLLEEDDILDFVDHEEVVVSDSEVNHLDFTLLDSPSNMAPTEPTEAEKSAAAQALALEQANEEMKKKLEAMEKKMEEMIKQQQQHPANLSAQESFVSKFFNCPVPEMERNVSYTDWRHSISLWKLATPIPLKDQGLAIALKLPMKDAYGGLQQLVTTRIDKEKLRTEEGYDLVMKELDKILKHPVFLRLINWLDKFENVKQRDEENIEAYLERVRTLVRLAKDEFSFMLPDQLHAAKLLTGCNGVTSANISVITNDIDLDKAGQGDGEMVTQVENALRKHVSTTSAMDKKKGTNSVFLTGVFGERLDSTESMDEEETNDTFFTRGKGGKGGKGGKDGKKKGDRKGKTAAASNSGRGGGKFPGRNRETYEREKIPKPTGPETIDERNRRLIHNRQCLECESDDHMRPNCEAWKERIAKRHEREGGHDGNPTKRGRGAGPSNGGRGDEVNDVNFVAIEEGDVDDDSLYLFDVDPEGTYSSYLTDNVTYNVKKVDENVHYDRGILDSGCQRSVAGEEAAKALIQQLHPDDRKQVQIMPSEAKFRFGDGKVHCSKGAWMVPVHIGGTKRYIMFDVVKCKLPLLLSMKFMQKIRLNLCHRGEGKDFCQIGQHSIKLHYDQGHNWISLTKENSDKDIIKDVTKDPMINPNSHQVYMTQVEVFTPGKEFCEIKKLHNNLSHPPKERLIAAIRATGNWSEVVAENVEKVYEHCPTRKCREKGQVQKPGNAAFKVVKEMGDLVSADLKISSTGKNILYMIDHATSYAVSSLIENKTTEEIIDKIISCWYANGLPRIKTFNSDNGLEFNGKAMQSFLQAMSTIHVNTVPYRPQQNGQCERVHAVIDLNMAKLMDSNPDMTQEQCLTWATYAYNQSESRSGHSPIQLVYGTGDNMTSTLTMTVGECENWDPQLRYAMSLKTRKEALINHLKFRNSQKMRQMILKRSIPTVDKKDLGTWVWLKRQNKYLGPGQVVSTIEHEAQIKIGNSYFRCRHGDLLPLNMSEIENYQLIKQPHQINKPDTAETVEIDIPENNANNFRMNDLPEVVEISQQRTAPAARTAANNTAVSNAASQAVIQDTNTAVSAGNSQQSDNVQSVHNDQVPHPDHITHSTAPSASDINTNNVTPQEPQTSVSRDSQTTNTAAADEVGNDNMVAEMGDQENIDNNEVVIPLGDQEIPDARGKFKAGDKLKLFANNEWSDITIISRYNRSNYRAGYKFKYSNDRSEKPTVYSADLNTSLWKKIDNTWNVQMTSQVENDQVYNVFNTVIPFSQHHLPAIKVAKEKELNSLKSFNTFQDCKLSQLSPEEKEDVIGSTWVVVWKGDQETGRYKARLCARGDRERQVNNLRTDSPTVMKSNLRIILTLAASNAWKIKSIDFSNAFVQGTDMPRRVFMLPPPDLRRDNPDLVWKIVKRLYGFKDASRGWWEELDQFLKSKNMLQVTTDKAMYIHYNKDGEMDGILGEHVDDLIVAGTTNFHKEVILPLLTKYVIGKEEISDFTFVGWDLKQDKSGITLSQSSFWNKQDLDRFEDLRLVQGDKNDKLDQTGQDDYRSALGVLGWVVQVSRPDLAFRYVEFSTKINSASVSDARCLYRVLEKAKHCNEQIKFSNLGNPRNWEIVAYSDSALHNLNKFDSAAGELILLKGNGKVNMLDWKCHKLKKTALSSLHAEAQAAVHTVSKVNFHLSTLNEILGPVERKVEIRIDSKALETSVNSTKAPQDKTIGLLVASLRESVEGGNIKFKFTPTAQNCADVLTKRGVKPDNIHHIMSKGILPFL